MPLTGSSYSAGFANTTLLAPSAIASSAGGQGFVIPDIGSQSLLYLNGNVGTLSFGNVPANTTSPVMTIDAYNVGNVAFTLGTSYTFTDPSNVFILTGTNCTEDTVLSPAGSCYGNLEFAPPSQQTYNGLITVGSNAYNSASTLVNLSGTGTAKGSVALSEQARPFAAGQSERKSFIHRQARLHLRPEGL